MVYIYGFGQPYVYTCKQRAPCLQVHMTRLTLALCLWTAPLLYALTEAAGSGEQVSSEAPHTTNYRPAAHKHKHTLSRASACASVPERSVCASHVFASQCVCIAVLVHCSVCASQCVHCSVYASQCVHCSVCA